MTWGFITLLVLGVVLYGVMAMNVASLRFSDAAGKGMAGAFAAISGVALWCVIVVLLSMGEPGMSIGYSIAIFFAVPVAVTVSMVDAVLGRRRYPVVMLPLPFLAIAIWARVSSG